VKKTKADVEEMRLFLEAPSPGQADPTLEFLENVMTAVNGQTVRIEALEVKIDTLILLFRRALSSE
jgi:hypothetical protein